ncbi:MAG: hypothetical protein NPINA01_10200 [Nitrospinaceae bacterium]|nr:MAG: hypothetical protein NPINA01_10200 [Nitrospinaceae bacterium]
MGIFLLFEFEDKALIPLKERVRARERLSFVDGATLWESFDLLGVGYLANIVRERLHGNKTFFIHNRHIHPTNHPRSKGIEIALHLHIIL